MQTVSDITVTLGDVQQMCGRDVATKSLFKMRSSSFGCHEKSAEIASASQAKM